MAIKHRKLFLPTTNQTTDCPEEFCDPTCLYSNCYGYDEPLPMPPPLPPPPSAGKTQNFSPYLIILMGFLAVSFLIVSYYVVIVKYCSGWNPFRRRRRQTQQSEPPDQDEFMDQNQRPAIDHPIWYINTIGLQQSVINSISVFNYKKKDVLIEGKECMVCLGEFQEDERLRLLPKCNHAFHIHCVDTWLRSHTNCPLCRAPIVSNTAISLPSNNNSVDLNETQMESLGRETEFGSTRENWDESRGDDDDDEADDDTKEMDVSASVLGPTLPENSAIFSGNVDTGTDRRRREMGCSSFRVESVKKKPVSIKRSISCGGRLLLPL